MTAQEMDKHGAGSPRLLDAVRARIRAKHYSLRTERAYLHWIRRFIYFHDKRHPREIGAAEVERFLSSLLWMIMFRHPRKIKNLPHRFFRLDDSISCEPIRHRGLASVSR